MFCAASNEIPIELRDSVAILAGDAPAHVDLLTCGREGTVLIRLSEETNWVGAQCLPLSIEGESNAFGLWACSIEYCTLLLVIWLPMIQYTADCKVLALLEAESRLLALAENANPAQVSRGGVPVVQSQWTPRRIQCHIIPADPFTEYEDGFSEEDEVCTAIHFLPCW